jgi:hypothetical protein
MSRSASKALIKLLVTCKRNFIGPWKQWLAFARPNFGQKSRSGTYPDKGKIVTSVEKHLDYLLVLFHPLEESLHPVKIPILILGNLFVLYLLDGGLEFIEGPPLELIPFPLGETIRLELSQCSLKSGIQSCRRLGRGIG